MDNSGKEKEALALIAEAEKKMKSSQSFFANMFGFVYQSEVSAGNAFAQAAQLHLQQQSKHDAATSFIDAGNAFKKADPQEAINCLNRAIEIYTDMAIAHYEQAADYYKGEESNRYCETLNQTGTVRP
ncbi:Beta-soluble NSF attachment protein [Acipenser ruthenus]|uniref:Beta-soluble NSF attachment protein n=1 Tax=Acipenser ruthenus TaxID=7906 RepID=A0A444UFU7_ACIRT|nr:Beta-soluble NSF attachment protein [Acipenser ruthenus]